MSIPHPSQSLESQPILAFSISSSGSASSFSQYPPRKASLFPKLSLSASHSALDMPPYPTSTTTNTNNQPVITDDRIQTIAGKSQMSSMDKIEALIRMNVDEIKKKQTTDPNTTSINNNVNSSSSTANKPKTKSKNY
jgi:hypothetical protein